MNKNNDNKIKLTFHPAEFGEKMPIPLAEQSVKAGFPSPAQDYICLLYTSDAADEMRTV